MTINVRMKGQRAERAAVALLQPVVTRVYMAAGWDEGSVPGLMRNQMQTVDGGYDIVGLSWLALEIKHQETLKVEQWWLQTIKQASKAGREAEPVLMYKQNNVQWRVRIWVNIPIHGSSTREHPTGWTQPHVVDISIDSFLEYFEARLVVEVRKEMAHAAK